MYNYSVHSHTLEPSKRARNGTCKSHDKVMMCVNKEPLGWSERFRQLIQMEMDHVWKLGALQRLLVPYSYLVLTAHSKLSWVSVDLTANRGNEMTGWKA